MIVERIKEFMDKMGITVAAFERSIGMSNASFGKSLKNKGAIGSDKIENILSVYPNLNPSWLLTGEGEMLKETTPETPEVPRQGVKREKENKKNEKTSSPTDSIIFLEYMKMKEAAIAEKDAIIEQKNREIATLNANIAKLETENCHLLEANTTLTEENRHLSEELSRSQTPSTSTTGSEEEAQAV